MFKLFMFKDISKQKSETRYIAMLINFTKAEGLLEYIGMGQHALRFMLGN